MPILRRTVAAGTLSMLLLFCSVPAALAHAQLVSSSPEQSSTLSEPPQTVTLEFTEPIDPGFVELAVIGPDRVSHWEAAAPAVKGVRVSAPIRPLGPAGRYAIKYRVLSADGHPVSGAVTFSLSKPGPATAAPGGSSSVAAHTSVEQEAMPLWPWIAGITGLLVLGVVVALRVARDPRDT